MEVSARLNLNDLQDETSIAPSFLPQLQGNCGLKRLATPAKPTMPLSFPLLPLARRGLVPLARPMPLRSQTLFHKRQVFGYKRYNSTVSSNAIPPPPPGDISEKIEEAEAVKENDEQKNVEETTGEIEKTVREGIFYFDNVYPVSPGRYTIPFEIFSRLLGLTERRVKDILVRHAFPPDLPVKFTQLIPRYKDGGAFAKYEISKDAPALTHEEVEATIYSHLKSHDYRPMFNAFRPMRVFAVLGVPWIEDLKRYSSKQVKVVFEGPDLSQEEIYKLLRRYGSIIDIVPPSPAAKDLPRSAMVEFQRLRDACTARNCVNSLTVGETKIHIEYVPNDKAGWFKKTVMDHPRIALPVVLALLATLAVIIFEPIRTFFIKRKVCSNHSLEKYRVFRWASAVYKTVVSTVTKYLRFDGRCGARFEDMWDARQESINTLQQWIEENVNTFIVVNGPRGSGKRDLVNKIALRDRPNVLQIDCEALTKSRNDTTFLKAAASQFGYYPVFPWMKNITTFIDLITQGLTGQKTGFAESIDVQFKSILNTTLSALREVALENYKRADQTELQISEDDYLQLHSEAKPVIVLSHYQNNDGESSGQSNHSNQFIYKQLADFAASAVTANIAHVVIISNDITFDKTLSVALPNHLFKVLTIGDADPQSAKSFVLQQILEANKTAEPAIGEDEPKEVAAPKASDYPGLDSALKPIGGRMTDLQSFARRIMSGEAPQRASQEMISQSMSELLQMFLFKKGSPWTTEQVWVLIKKLADLETRNKDRDLKRQQQKANSSGGWFGFGSSSSSSADPVALSNDLSSLPVLAYSDLIADANFKTFEQQQALLALQHAEMITVQQEGGRPVAVKAGKPLFQAAFRALVNDKELCAMMETQLLNKLHSAETAKITACEEELRTLSQLQSRKEVRDRVDYLAVKLGGAQTKIAEYEAKLARHAEILAKAKK